MSQQDDAIMAELESGDTFDESRLPIERRIGLIKNQIRDWEESAYSAKVAFQTNKQLGVATEELAPFVAQFARCRKAAQYLETQLAELESEERAANRSRLRHTSAA